jgi:sec-independent protein translocase protein TatA
LPRRAEAAPLNLAEQSYRDAIALHVRKTQILTSSLSNSIDKSLSVNPTHIGRANGLALMDISWVIVLAIIVILLLWGPQKLPEFARSIGQARREIETAYKEVQNPNAAPRVAETDPLVETAKKLGISTEGKTRAQISDEIVAKAKGPSTTS